MNTITDIELIQASDIKVDASVIDVSEVEEQEDKDYLIQQGSEILTIDAKADYAIKKIVATIQGRASLEKGRVIAEVQDRFRKQFPGGDGLGKWYKSVGLNAHNAQKWANAYRATAEFQELFDGLVEPTKVLECADSTLDLINKLPRDYKEEVLANIAVGEVPTYKETSELSKQPEVKLSKAEELLAAAKARKEKADERWEEVKKDEKIDSKSSEYLDARTGQISADKSIKNFEQQILELKAEIEEAKLKTAECEAREAKTKAELQKLKFDDAKTRAERIKRLTSSLTVGVPQALADLQKFFAEKDHYPDEVRKHILEQSTYLANYIGDQL